MDTDASTAYGMQKGQVLVILALALVGIILFAGLTIDGGMVFSDRRVAQNAVDSSAIAGAGTASQIIKNATSWSCADYAAGSTNWNNITAQAIDRAQANGFTIDTDLSDKNGVEVICSSAPDYLDVRTLISQPVETSLIHMVYPWPIVNTVEAISRVKPPIWFGAGMAIVATREECTNLPGNGWDGGITFTGDSEITVTAGGAYSNACVNTRGTAGGVHVNNGIGYLTDWNDSGAKLITPHEPVKSTEKIFIDDSGLQINCEDLPNYASPVNVAPNGAHPDVTIDPGNYGNITINNNRTLVMHSGLYCIHGSVDFKGKVDGVGVTIYMPPTAGGFSTMGDGDITLTAPPQGCHNPGFSPPYAGCPDAIGGLLLYYRPALTGTCSSCSVALRGNADSNYVGTVYVPNSTVEIGGTNSTMSEVGAQVIARTVFVHGTSALTIKYEKDLVYKEDTKLQLKK